MKLYIKHMVCNRCIKAVENILASTLSIKLEHIELGTVTLTSSISEEEKSKFSAALSLLGFELLDNEKSERVTQIKTLIINEIHHGIGLKQANENFSVFISSKMGYDYSYLNELFSSLEGKTIGQYITLQKIERAKELIIYDQLGLAVIADQLEYNSAQYLSAQFKKTTGMTPSEFKKIGQRKSLDYL
jgi:AraC family transcriptional regulator